jgi:hypothetical protein
MLLESNGIRIDIKAPAEIEKLKRAGYVEVKGVKVKSEPKSREDILADAPEKGEKEIKLPAGIKLAVESLGLESPEELSEIPDADLLDIKGIGKGTLNSIRESFPLAPEKDGE